ncbi:MAG TPA: phosphoribosyltransferase family protein [Gemmatimonadales bacterium]|jgi:predicted phosphoribosyltransferase|nr:phosphoribosyltransferase family protein [Gemmatimonadales bacterium]
MTALFTNRYDAGRQLAARLRPLAGRPDLIVLGLPRGGVPVAAEVADALGAALDVFVVRKLGAPGHAELAMGAVASGGVRVVERDVVRELHVSREMFDQATEQELREIERRERAYRDGRTLPDLKGATVILVDDGVATGATMLAGIYALRQLGPAAVIAAAPVMSRQAYRTLTEAADQCACVAMPEPFYGVGMHYVDFEQTSDEEVRAVLLRGGSADDRSVLHAAQR